MKKKIYITAVISFVIAALSMLTGVCAEEEFELQALRGRVESCSLVPFGNRCEGEVVINVGNFYDSDVEAALALYGEDGRLLSVAVSDDIENYSDSFQNNHITFTFDGKTSYSEPVSSVYAYIWNKGTQMPLAKPVTVQMPVTFAAELYDDNKSTVDTIYAYLDGFDKKPTSLRMDINRIQYNEGMSGFYVNGVRIDVRSYNDYARAVDTYIIDNKSGNISLTDVSSGDGVYDLIYVTKYLYAVTGDIETANGKTTVQLSGANPLLGDSWTIDTSDDSKTYIFDLDGKEIDPSELKKGDVLSVAYDLTKDFADANFYRVLVSRKTVKASVLSIAPDERGDLYYEYSLSDTNTYKLADPEYFTGAEDIESGVSYLFYLEASGRILSAVRDASDTRICILDSVYVSNGDQYYANIYTQTGERKQVSIKNADRYNEYLRYCYTTDNNGNCSNNNPKLSIYDRVYSYKLNSLNEITVSQKQQAVNIEDGTELTYNAESDRLGAYKLDSSTALLDTANYESDGTISAIKAADLTDGKTYLTYVFAENPAAQSYLVMLVDADAEIPEDTTAVQSGVCVLDSVYVSNGNMYYANIFTQSGEKLTLNIKNYERFMEYLWYCYEPYESAGTGVSGGGGGFSGLPDGVRISTKLAIYDRVYNYKINSNNELIINSSDKEPCLNIEDFELSYDEASAALGAYKVSKTATALLNISEYENDGTISAMPFEKLNDGAEYSAYVFGGEQDNFCKLILIGYLNPFTPTTPIAIYSHLGIINTEDGEKTVIYAYTNGSSEPEAFILDDYVIYVTGYTESGNGYYWENAVDRLSLREGDPIALRQELDGNVTQVIELFSQTGTLRSGSDILYSMATANKTALEDIIAPAQGFAAKYFKDQKHTVEFKFGQIFTTVNDGFILNEYNYGDGVLTDPQALKEIYYAPEPLIYSYDYNKRVGSRIAPGDKGSVQSSSATITNGIIDWSAQSSDLVNYAFVKLVDGKAAEVYAITNLNANTPESNISTQSPAAFDGTCYDYTSADAIYAYLNGEPYSTMFKLDRDKIFSGTDGCGFYVNGVQLQVNNDSAYNAAVSSYIENSANIASLEDNNGDGLYDRINVTVYKTAIVDSVRVISDTEAIVYFDDMAAGLNASLPVDTEEEGIEYRISFNGEEINASELKEGDVLSVAYDLTNSFSDSSFYTVFVSRNTVSGTVEAITPADNELDYEFAMSNYKTYKIADTDLINAQADLECGGEYTLFLDVFGRIAKADKSLSSARICIIDSVYVSNGDRYYANIFTQTGEKKQVNIKNQEKYQEYMRYCYEPDYNGNYYSGGVKLPIYDRVYDYKLNASNEIIINASDKENCKNRFDDTALTYKAGTNKLGSYKINDALTSMLDISDYASDGTISSVTSAGLDDDEDYDAYVFGKNPDNSAQLILIMAEDPGFTTNTEVVIYSKYGTTYTDDGEKTVIYAYANGESTTTGFILSDDADFVTGYQNSEYGYQENMTYSMPDYKEGDPLILKTNSRGEVTKVVPMFDTNGLLKKGYSQLYSMAISSKTALEDIIAPAVGFSHKYFIDAKKKEKDIVRFKFGPIVDKSDKGITLGEYMEVNDGYSFRSLATDTTALNELPYASDVTIYVYDYSKGAGSRISLGAKGNVLKTQISNANGISLDKTLIDWTTFTYGTSTYGQVNYAFVKTVEDEVREVYVILPSTSIW